MDVWSFVLLGLLHVLGGLRGFLEVGVVQDKLQREKKIVFFKVGQYA